MTASRTAAESKTSTQTTQNFSPALAADSAADLAAEMMVALDWEATALLASRRIFCKALRSSLSACLRTVGRVAESKTCLMALTSCSNAAPVSFLAPASWTASSSAARTASRALDLVSPVIRRTPLAMPSSCSSTKHCASPVEERCVPPQNSVLCAAHLEFLGSASRSSTREPTETTRTGSGYTSPNTALKPVICLACSNDTSLALTKRLACTISCTRASTLASSAGSTCLPWEKSNLSFSGSTKEPF
mmetsp:Transcript_22644/g.31588  ORF Transcript_22644/g.31588 Transcript_22644/m.31588 type:complete len:248 (-) Transcript_22644:2037-2780(-)